MDAPTPTAATPGMSTHPLLPVLAACLPEDLPAEAPAELADLVAELRAAPGAGIDLDPFALARLARRLAALTPGALELVRQLPDLVVPPATRSALWTPKVPVLWTPGSATASGPLWLPGGAGNPIATTPVVDLDLDVDLGPDLGPDDQGLLATDALLAGFADALDQALHTPPPVDDGETAARLTATREAVRFFREAVRQQPTAFLPDLATALVEHSAALDAAGRPDAVTAAEDAVAIRQHLAKHDRIHLPDLARALHNLGDRLAAADRHGDRVAALEDAVAIRRHLVQAHPSRHLPDLAVALDRLAAGLQAAGRPADQVVALEDAVAIRRHLAGVLPPRFLPDLAASLHAMSLALPADRRHEALASIREAVTIRRRLAEGDPVQHLPDLATSVHTLSVGLGSLGQHPEGLAAGEEATHMFELLVRYQPKPYTAGLVGSLENLAISLGAMGRHDEALAAGDQAALLQRGRTVAAPEARAGGPCWCSCHDSHHGMVLDTTATTGPTPVVVI
jgi:tetratricopeptide (TPR) repeat protein